MSATITNQSADTGNQAIAAGEKDAVALVEQFAIISRPWLGYIGIKQMFHFVLNNWIGDPIRKALETIYSFGKIDQQIGTEETGMSRALKDLAAAEKSGDKEAIANAIKEYQKAQSGLINYDGSADIK